MSKDSDANRESVRIVQLWHKAGGRLDYIVMDSPMFFPVYVAKDCHFSIDEAARYTAATLRGILAEYPNIKIVDAEGPARNSNDKWLADMTAWLRAFRAASGRSVDDVELDLHWTDLRPSNTWQDTVRRSVAVFRPLGVGTGLIINADVPHMTPTQWIGSNRDHIHEAIEGHMGLDFLEIAEWTNNIQMNLPESNPQAYTSLVNVAYDAIARSNPH